MFITPLSEVKLMASGSLEEAGLQEKICQPILDVLTGHKPPTLRDVEQAVDGYDVNFVPVLEVVMILFGTGYLDVVQDSLTTVSGLPILKALGIL